MDKSVNNAISARLAELRKMLDRRGRKAFTQELRIELLEEVYDHSLVRAVECAITGSSKFSGTATMLMNSAREEIRSLQMVEESNFGAVEISFDVASDEQKETAQA